MERAFKGVWIPKDIWISKNLTVMEKLFLVEIESLDNEDGCFANNSHFADFFSLSKNRCSEIIKSLEQKNKISIEYEQAGKVIKKRILKVAKGVFGKPTEGYSENRQTPSENRQTPSEKLEENNTINNTVIERSALAFLEENAPMMFESFMMNHKKNIVDFEKFKLLFNCKFDEEDLRYETKIINARLIRFATNYIENERSANFKNTNRFPVQPEVSSPSYNRVKFN